MTKPKSERAKAMELFQRTYTGSVGCQQPCADCNASARKLLAALAKVGFFVTLKPRKTKT